VCPNGPGPGEIQVGTTGGSGGVAVIPICASDGREDSSDPAYEAPVTWETRWGAIATGSNGWGAVTDMRSERQAKSAALKQCKKSETGKGSKCKALTYYNQCAVVIISPGAAGFFLQRAIDLPTASSMGMKSCREEYSTCEIFYSGCSHARRVN
jgi:Domain of unknown function (DUF4189)